MFPFGSIFSLGAGADSVTLSGSLGSPNSKTHLAISPDDAIVYWAFVVTSSAPSGLERGYVARAGYDAGDPATYINQAAWVTPLDFQRGPYYIRATVASGDSPTEGDSLNTWLSLVNGGSNRFWGWRENGVFGNTIGIIKVEIATDSGGSNIIATGYYRGIAQTEP